MCTGSSYSEGMLFCEAIYVYPEMKMAGMMAVNFAVWTRADDSIASSGLGAWRSGLSAKERTQESRGSRSPYTWVWYAKEISASNTIFLITPKIACFYVGVASWCMLPRWRDLFESQKASRTSLRERNRRSMMAPPEIDMSRERRNAQARMELRQESGLEEFGGEKEYTPSRRYAR